MGNFFAELKRRHIFRVAAAYAVVAWVLLQVVTNVTPLMQAPLWVGQFCLLLLVLGFPLAIFFAWTREMPASDTAGLLKATATDGGLIGVLLVVIALISYQEFAPPATPAVVPGVDAARVAAANPQGVSIAVLPFDNISGDAGQDYFSEGMTEEITSALAKVPDLRIVARTSASQFKAQNRDIQSIGQQLHASHFIEGSVRKAGDRVRISVQLIKTDDGTHVWVENYDRAVTDIFALQEDIARTVVSSLRMPLGLKPGENLVSNRNIDPDSDAQYLRAKAFVLARGPNVKEAAPLLEQIVAKNPNYAPAWALLTRAYGGDDRFPDRAARAAKSLAAAQRAVSLDPNNAEGLTRLAVEQLNTSFLGYYELTQRALSLDANNPEILHSYAFHMASVGYVKEALAIRQKLLEAEPLFDVSFSHLAVALWLNGRTDAAIEMLKIVPPQFDLKNTDLAIIDASMGRYNDAADALEKVSGPNFPPDMVAEAVNLLRMAPAKPASPQSLPSLGDLSWVFLHVGALERVLDDLTLPGGAGYTRAAIVWHPSFAAVRKTEAFKAWERKDHFLDFWRAKGWPPQCHPTTGDDFECN